MCTPRSTLTTSDEMFNKVAQVYRAPKICRKFQVSLQFPHVVPSRVSRCLQTFSLEIQYIQHIYTSASYKGLQVFVRIFMVGFLGHKYNYLLDSNFTLFRGEMLKVQRGLRVVYIMYVREPKVKYKNILGLKLRSSS